MCAALVGDSGWMAEFFGKEASEGRSHVFLTGREAGLSEAISGSDVVVLITDQVSHAVRRRVLYGASIQNLPIVMRHSSGALAVKKFLLATTANVRAEAA